MVAVVAAAAVLFFITSMVLVVVSDGTNEQAAQVCIYSMVASFVTLVLYQPTEGKKTLIWISRKSKMRKARYSSWPGAGPFVFDILIPFEQPVEVV